MAHSAKHLKESLGQGEDMERDDERVETHISGVRNLSEEAREMRAAGRKLVGENEEKAQGERGCPEGRGQSGREEDGPDAL